MKYKQAKTKGLPKLLEYIRCKLNQASVEGHGSFPVLRIEGGINAPAVGSYRIFLDGVDISSGLRNIELHIGQNEGIHAHLEIIVRPDIPDILLRKIYLDKIEDPLDLLETGEAFETEWTLEEQPE